MSKKLVYTFLGLTLCSGAAFAFDNPLDDSALDSMRGAGFNILFNDNNTVVVQAATMNATVSNASYAVQPGAQSSDAGNVIGSGAFAGAFGIMQVNQNTGANSNVQQSLNFYAHDITIGVPPH